MKYKITLSLFFLLLFSCSTINTIEWNEKMTKIYDETVNSIEDLEELISLETMGDPAVVVAITQQGNSLLDKISNSRILIQENKIPSNAENYQYSMLKYLEALEAQTKIGLEFASFKENTPESKVEKYSDRYDIASKETKSRVQYLIAVQDSLLIKASH